MKNEIFVIVTSIAAPNRALQQLANGCTKAGWQFIVIGDAASPKDFTLDGCDFYGLERQKKTDLKFAQICPERHYARKNIGYLLAIENNASMIIETDDDNFPYPKFFEPRKSTFNTAAIENAGWVNMYSYFTEQNIWPRGFALEKLSEKIPAYKSLPQKNIDCPIQQGLANDNPDVDAIYRLTLPLPQTFRKDVEVALADGSWCPFNSQNTTWLPKAFELLYLPSYCSFRMTDIWRSFIAQKIVQINGWAVLFTEPTVRQERNEHELLRDFSDEVPGYLNNGKICEALDGLALEKGDEKIADNLKICYEKLIAMNLVGREELNLLDAWLEDLGAV
ncbi:MAG: DUF288 domain-containing protein [Planctomycetes bacterium]|nr:DUF288 domain-containing protein [Planctomycetota bacterium]